MLLASPVFAQTPVASVRSGNWDDPAMWSTGRMPTEADAVTLASGHTVYVTSNAAPIASLTLESNAVMMRQSGADGLWVLTVTGNVANAGTIHRYNVEVDIGYDRLMLRVGGSIANTGRWAAEVTELNGAAPQTISSTTTLEGAWVEATPDSPMVAGSDLAFLERLDLGGGTFQLGGFRLRLQRSAQASLVGNHSGPVTGRVVTTTGAAIESVGAPSAQEAALWRVLVEGPVTLEGYHNIGEDVTLSGPLTVASGAVLQRYSGPDGPRNLVVEGSVTNLGTIRPSNMDSDIGYDRLHLIVGGRCDECRSMGGC